MTFEQIKTNEEIKTYIIEADASLKSLGFTEHSFAHVTTVANRAAKILEALNFDERTIELVKIAGYMHDIGNLVNRVDHSLSGAILAFKILKDMNMEPKEIAKITTAIGNHDEGTGVPVSELAAALIIADKSDVRRSRVRNISHSNFDIHDRVNYSVIESDLVVLKEEMTILLKLKVDTTISSVMEYFEIFLNRMVLCKKAASFLGFNFKLLFNDQQMI